MHFPYFVVATSVIGKFIKMQLKNHVKITCHVYFAWAEDLYWMKPVRGVLNSLTGIPGEKEVILEIREITENSGTFTIRNAANKLCLENQG